MCIEGTPGDGKGIEGTFRDGGTTKIKLAENFKPSIKNSISNPRGPFKEFFENNPDLEKILEHCDNTNYCTEEAENSTEEVENNGKVRAFSLTIGDTIYHFLDLNGYGKYQFSQRNWGNNIDDSGLKIFIEKKQKENEQRHMIYEDEFKHLYQDLRSQIKRDLGNKHELNDDEKKLLLSYVTELDGGYIISNDDERFICQIPPVGGFRDYSVTSDGSKTNPDKKIYGSVLLVRKENTNPQNS